MVLVLLEEVFQSVESPLRDLAVGLALSGLSLTYLKIFLKPISV